MELVKYLQTNYDLSLEWYFSRSGSLTGALFRREANGFIFNDVRVIPDPVYNYLQINQPVIFPPPAMATPL